jgi:hypothetical protein
MRKLGLVATVPLLTVWVTERPATGSPVVVPVSVSVAEVVVVDVVVSVSPVVDVVESVVVGATVVVGASVVDESVEVTGLVVVGVSVVGGDVGESVDVGASVVGAVDPSVPLMESVPAVVSSAHPAASDAAHTSPNTAPHLRASAVRRMLTPSPKSDVYNERRRSVRAPRRDDRNPRYHDWPRSDKTTLSREAGASAAARRDAWG